MAAMDYDGCNSPVDGVDIGNVGLAGISTVIDKQSNQVEIRGAGAGESLW